MSIIPGTSLNSLGPLSIASSTGGSVSPTIQSTIISANASDKGPTTQAMAQAVNPHSTAPAVTPDGVDPSLTADTIGFS